jgi:hypothetical protein
MAATKRPVGTLGHGLGMTVSLCAALCCVGCTPRTAPPAAAPGADAGSAAVHQRLAELDQKIAAMEQRQQSKSTGQGAYRSGPLLLVAGQGQESVLERLRRLERELTAAQALSAQQSSELAALRSGVKDANSDRVRLNERVAYLDHTREALDVARSAIRERDGNLETLQAQFAASELQRLRAERDWYQMAGEILRLPPDRVDRIEDLQNRVRGLVRDVQTPAPNEGKASAKPSAKPAATEAHHGH